MQRLAPVVLSQSALQDYTDCRRRFQLRYLDKLEYPGAECEPGLDHEKRQQEGQQFHRLIHQYWLGIAPAKLSPSSLSVNLQRWWHNFMKTDFKLSGCKIYPEASLSAPLAAFRLVAKLDAVAVHSGKYIRIFDWKTYQRRPRTEWLAGRLQTRIYPSLLARAGAYLNQGLPIDPERIEMVYWFSDFPADSAHFSYDSSKFNRDWEFLSDLAAQLATASEFPKTDDLQECRYCPYRSHCDRGTRAGGINAQQPNSVSDDFFDLNFEQIGEIAF